MILRSLITGRLRLHGADFARLQRALDPLVATGLFVWLLGDSAWNHSELLLQPWLWVAVCTAVLLPLGGIYGSYRNRSLLLLSRRLLSSWLLVCTAVLGLSFATKTTTTFSRLDASLWALLVLLVLQLSHVGLRQQPQRDVLGWSRGRSSLRARTARQPLDGSATGGLVRSPGP